MIRRVIASPNVLWPANHKMVPVRISVLATDACCRVRSRIVGVRCNEEVNATGDGNTSPDWEITGPLTLQLRAEHAGKGRGRIYYITVQSTDCAGNTTMGRTIVTVPHHQGSKR